MQADFVLHARRTKHDAVYLALGSYKTIKFKADITIGKLTKSWESDRGKDLYSPSAAKFKEPPGHSPHRAPSHTTSELITASSMGLKVEVYKYNGPGSQNHSYNSNFPVLYRCHPAEHPTMTDSMDLALRDSQLLVSEMMSLAKNVASMWSLGLEMPYRVMEYHHRCPEVDKAIEGTMLPPLTDLAGPPFKSKIRTLSLLEKAQL